jgi:hypothetical protein
VCVPPPHPGVAGSPRHSLLLPRQCPCHHAWRRQHRQHRQQQGRHHPAPAAAQTHGGPGRCHRAVHHRCCHADSAHPVVVTGVSAVDERGCCYCDHCYRVCCLAPCSKGRGPKGVRGRALLTMGKRATVAAAHLMQGWWQQLVAQCAALQPLVVYEYDTMVPPCAHLVPEGRKLDRAMSVTCPGARHSGHAACCWFRQAGDQSGCCLYRWRHPAPKKRP